MKKIPETIWTIGHSTRAIEDLIEILKAYNIELLADIRSYPGSKRFPQFNKENLAKVLLGCGIKYEHIVKLGGRRKANPDSKNTVWKNEPFRGYADYMETPNFKEGIEELFNYANEFRTAIMCSEGSWRSCHRSMVSDYLKSVGIRVCHIVDKSKSEEHPYTKQAMIINDKLTYEDEYRLKF